MLLNNWLEYCDLKCGRIDKILWSERDRVGESTQNIKELNEEWKNRMEWNFFLNTSIEYHNYNERYWFTMNQHTSYWVTQKNPAEKPKYVFKFRTVNVHQVQNIYW